MNKRKRPSKIRHAVWALLCIFGLGGIVHKYIDQLPIPETPIIQQDKESSITDRLEIPAKSIQDNELLIQHKGYTVSYNSKLKIPNWVAWKLNAGHTKGKSQRSDLFLPDPHIAEASQAYDTDYRQSGYDRGHMAPAGDMKWDQQAMDESFYLSNICPQAPELNQGSWRIIEEHCREWVNKEKGELYIVCGPIISKEESKHKQIGKNRVTVPEGFFKVILMNRNNQYDAVGFIFSNDNSFQRVSAHAVYTDQVEKTTGMDFFPSLPDSIENRIESLTAYDELF